MLHVAGSIAVLVVARLLQGASAAVVWVGECEILHLKGENGLVLGRVVGIAIFHELTKPFAVGLALLADTVGSEGVGVAIGYVAVGMSIGMLVGPLLGGVVYDHGGYNAVFAMCYILIGIDVFLRVVLIEKKVAARWISQGSHTASATMGEIDRVTVIPSPTENPNTRPQSSPAQQIGSSQDDPSPSKSPQENINTTTSPSPPLTRSHSKRRYKLPPIIFLLSSKRMCAALFATLALASLISCFDSVMPLYVKRLWGWSSTGAGLIFLPVVIPTLISPAVGWLTDRYGARWPATIGFVLATPCYVCLRFVDENTLSDKVLLCALLGLAGVALTLSLGPIMAEITYQVSAKEEKHPGIFGAGGAYAQAYGLFNMAFAGGTVVGPIWSGFVNEKAGWATMAWTLALLSIVTAVPTAMYVGGELSFSKGVGREKRK